LRSYATKSPLLSPASPHLKHRARHAAMSWSWGLARARQGRRQYISYTYTNAATNERTNQHPAPARRSTAAGGGERAAAPPPQRKPETRRTRRSRRAESACPLPNLVVTSAVVQPRPAAACPCHGSTPHTAALKHRPVSPQRPVEKGGGKRPQADTKRDETQDRLRRRGGDDGEKADCRIPHLDPSPFLPSL
jgi:hypothetical protein